TPFDQVRRWAPAAHAVQPAAITVPGLALFKVTPPPTVPADVPPYVIVGVAGSGGGKILDDPGELMRAAAAATQDAPLLARLALLVYRKDGELLTAATTDAQRKAKVAAPAITGQALDFWVSSTGADRALVRGRLDLSAGTLDFPPAGASKPPPPKSPPPPPKS